MQKRMSRRQVLGMMAAGAAAVTCPHRAALAADSESKFPPGRYVDVHVHIGTIPVGRSDPLTAEELLRWMDASDIAQSFVLPLVSPEAYPNPVSTEYVLLHTSPYRDRLIPFCVIDPRNSWYNSGERLRKQLAQYVEQGAKGFGEHKPGIAIDDPRNMELYAACQEVGLPVLFHLDAERNTDQPGLPGLEKVLKAFPDLNFIGHAPGFWASISGNVRPVDLGSYPKTKITPGGALDRLFGECPNLYADVSAGSGHNALTRDPDFTVPFLLRNADRILFGTDYLWKQQDTGQLDLFRRLDLPEDVQRKIFRENARRLIGIS